MAKRIRFPWPVNFLRRMESQPNGCIYFTGYVNNRGYGQITKDGRRVEAHVAAYRLFVGPVPSGLQLDHTCHTNDPICEGGWSCLHRRCVNPEHLEPVTPAENTRRGQSAKPFHGRTHCKNGHEYNDANVRTRPSGYHECIPCALERKRRFVARHAGSP